jgi:L-lactate dehydrogenase (cytochrome)/lactate 2-monooxygenase
VFGHRPAVPTAPDALAESARRRMTRTGWSYVAGGAGAQRTVDANRVAFDRYRIVPRQMVDVGERSLATTLLWRDLPAPLLFAPVGALELAVQHQLDRGGRRAAPRNAEPALARAARDLGLPVVISTQASTPMEDTAAALGDSPRWFQLYWSSDDSLVESFVRRAETCGCEAIVVTLDTHVLGWRTRDLDLGPTWRNLTQPYARAAVETFLDVFSRSTLTWTDLAWLRERTTLPILVKGTQHPDDARAALGADAVVLGRPWVYGLALAGADGVRAVTEHVLAELDLTMALAGVSATGQIGRHNLAL